MRRARGQAPARGHGFARAACYARPMKRTAPAAVLAATLLVAALVLAAVPGAAAACSVAEGYRPPTNLELAQQAEAIVLGQVIEGQLQEQDPARSTVTIRPLAVIKGEQPAGDIALEGLMLSRDAGPELGVLSNPFELREPHPNSLAGACIRYVFPLGTTALFFLKAGDGGSWEPAGGPFSRWAEDVPDAEAPWVRLARLYAAPDALPLLAEEREALLARADDPVAQLMAADIARQLEPGAPPAAAPPETEEAGFREAGDTAVEAALEAMRRRAIEAGN